MDELPPRLDYVAHELSLFPLTSDFSSSQRMATSGSLGI
jgi:hypothetical protein